MKYLLTFITDIFFNYGTILLVTGLSLSLIRFPKNVSKWLFLTIFLNILYLILIAYISFEKCLWGSGFCGPETIAILIYRHLLINFVFQIILTDFVSKKVFSRKILNKVRLFVVGTISTFCLFVLAILLGYFVIPILTVGIIFVLLLSIFQVYCFKIYSMSKKYLK